MLGDAREMRPWAAAAAAGAVCGGAALLWYRRVQRAPEVAELRGFDLISRMAAPLAPLTAKEFVTLLQCTSRPTATYCRDVIAAAVAGGAGYRVDIEEALPALVAVGDVDWEMDIFPEPAVRFALERLGFIVARTYIADVEAALEPTATAAGNAPRAAELIGLLHERHDGHGPRYGYIRRFLVPMADAALQRRLAALRRSDRAALARYYRVALASSLPAAAVAAGLTCLSGRLALAGLRHRAVLEEGFMCGAPLPCPVPIVRALRGLGASPVVAGLAWGVAVEGGLAVAGAAVQHIHSTVVAAAAARYREARKREVVYALSRVPVGHHEVQGEDEVEQLLCYPNDLEGVEVHIVFSLFALGLAAQNAATAAAAVGYSPRLLCTLCGLAFVSHRLDAWARSLSRWCARNTRDAEELGLSDARGPDDATPGGACPLPFSDPADFENRTVRSTTAQVPLLVDTSAVEHHATLRPFAADSGLVLAWQAFAARRTTSSLRAVVLGSGAPMVQAALATLRFALPLAAVAVVSARHDGAVGPVVALDVQRGVAGVVTAVVAVAAHWETITLNAFKAAALEAVCDRAAWEPSHADPPHPDPEAVTGAVLDAVDFAYPTRPDRPVLSGATLRLPLRARTLVALTGASGCGKSTVLQLLLALRRPTAGTVALETPVGPVDVAAADVRWLRRGVFSYVPQSAAVLPASVAENVLLRRVAGGDASAVSEAEAALRKAGLGALLQTLPEGVHTPLGGGLHSVTLSGGEATRLGIARALAQGGRVLLADEPTAALDDESAAQILASFRAVADQGRCVVLVTHDERVTCCVDTVLDMAV